MHCPHCNTSLLYRKEYLRAWPWKFGKFEVTCPVCHKGVIITVKVDKEQK